MSGKEGETSDATVRRKARLAEALRANLQKRKAQSRSRRIGQADSRPEGLPAAIAGNAGREQKD